MVHELVHLIVMASADLLTFIYESDILGEAAVFTIAGLN